MTPTGSIQPASPRPKHAQPTTNHGNDPSPTAAVPRPSTTITNPRTGTRPITSAIRPTGSSATRSTNWASMSRPDTPPRSSPNSRVPRSGSRNWLTDDQASASTMPTANIVHSVSDMPSPPRAPDTGAS